MKAKTQEKVWIQIYFSRNCKYMYLFNHHRNRTNDPAFLTLEVGKTRLTLEVWETRSALGLQRCNISLKSSKSYKLVDTVRKPRATWNVPTWNKLRFYDWMLTYLSQPFPSSLSLRGLNFLKNLASRKTEVTPAGVGGGNGRGIKGSETISKFRRL